MCSVPVPSSRARRLLASLLLAAFLAGLGVTTLTRDWIGLLPHHRHLVPANVLGLRHPHPGGALDRARVALLPADRVALNPTSAAGVADERPLSCSLTGVISFWSEPTTRFGYSGFFFAAVIAPGAAAFTTGGMRLAALSGPLSATRHCLPPKPPPRPARPA